MSPEEPGSNPHEFQSFFSFSFAKNQSLQYLTLYLFLSAGCEKDHLCWNVVVKYISRMFWVTEKNVFASEVEERCRGKRSPINLKRHVMTQLEQEVPLTADNSWPLQRVQQIIQHYYIRQQ